MYKEKLKLHDRRGTKKEDLRTIALDITGKCNMHYRFCYKEMFPNKDPIELDILRRTGTDFMAITLDGNVLPCNFIQATLGNIRDKSLRQMRNDLLRSEGFNKEYPFCILGESKEFFEQIV